MLHLLVCHQRDLLLVPPVEGDVVLAVHLLLAEHADHEVGLLLHHVEVLGQAEQVCRFSTVCQGGELEWLCNNHT